MKQITMIILAASAVAMGQPGPSTPTGSTASANQLAAETAARIAADNALTAAVAAKADAAALASGLAGKENALGNPATNGWVLSSTTAGVRSWVAPPSGGTWGSITGTLASQTDLATALGLKGNLSGGNTWSGAQTFSNAINLANGSQSAAAIGFGGALNTGIYGITRGVAITEGGGGKVAITGLSGAGYVIQQSNGQFGWSTSWPAESSIDTRISRAAAGVVAIGNAASTTGGSLTLGGLTASGALVSTATTASTSTSTGSIIAGGGLGVAGAANIGGAVNIAGQTELTGQAATNATSAMTRGLGDARYAPSDLQTRAWTGTSQILVADDAGGAAQTLALNGTRLVSPGPGTATLSLAPTGSLTRYERGELLLTPPTVGQGPTLTYNSQTAAAGLTMIVRLVPGIVRGSTGNTAVGFADTATRAHRRGIIRIYPDANPSATSYIAISNPTSATDQTEQAVAIGPFADGEEIAVAIKYESLTKRSFWMQGGRFASMGCTLGSEHWYLLGEDQNNVDYTGSVVPFILHQSDGVARIRSVRVLSSWSPSERHKAFNFDCPSTVEPTAMNGTHVPSIVRDPVTGLVLLNWQIGTDDINQNVGLRYSTRLASGAWTAPADVPGLTATISPNPAIGVGHLSVVGNAVWLVYSKRPSAGDGGTIHRRTVTVNPSTGVWTMGPEVDFGFTGTNLTFSPVITLANGNLVVPYQKQVSSVYKPYVAVSTNGGTSWTEYPIFLGVPSGTGLQATPTVAIEPTIFLESGANTIGCYMRSDARCAFYSRSTDGGVTWSTPVPARSIPQSGTGTRMIAFRHPNGTNFLIGHDNTLVRRAVTIWQLGDNGAVGEKQFFGDIQNAETGTGTGLMQYPFGFFEDSNNILVAYSCRPFNNVVKIQLHSERWAQPVAVEAGGTGSRGNYTPDRPREALAATRLTYGTAPVPDMALGNRFHLTLTASTATIGAPLNPLPWEELTIHVLQDATGSRTLAGWNAAYQFNGLTPTLQSGPNAMNTFRFIYNPFSATWVIQSFQ